MLQGAMIRSTESHLMRDDLRKKGLIPLTEPYSAKPHFTHIGKGGGETMDASMLDETGENACVDWVFLELCAANNIDSVVATKAALIQRDGDVMTIEGDSLIPFGNVPPGDYYVALRHRNHLKMLSLNSYTFSQNSIPFVDFTYEFTPVIGNVPNVDLDGTKALWSGDINGDENGHLSRAPKRCILYVFAYYFGMN